MPDTVLLIFKFKLELGGIWLDQDIGTELQLVLINYVGVCCDIDSLA